MRTMSAENNKHSIPILKGQLSISAYKIDVRKHYEYEYMYMKLNHYFEIETLNSFRVFSMIKYCKITA